MKYLKIGYADMSHQAINASAKDVEDEPYFFIVQCNKDNIAEGINLAKQNKWIIAIEYLDEPCEIPEHDGIHVYTIVSGTTDYIPCNIFKVYKLNKAFCDMRAIKDYCTKYEDISYINGNFVKLKGVRIGEIPDDKLPKLSLRRKGTLLFNDTYEAMDTDYYDNVADNVNWGTEPYIYANATSNKRATKSSKSSDGATKPVKATKPSKPKVEALPSFGLDCF